MPLHESHPRGWQNPVNLRASAALPAAGAWDATPTESFTTGTEFLTLFFTYTRAAVGGAFDWQMQVSPYAVIGNVPTGAQEWTTESLYAPGVMVPGADAASNAQREFTTYVSQGAAAEAFVYGPIEVRWTIERIRIYARESGVIGSPGTLQITMELY